MDHQSAQHPCGSKKTATAATFEVSQGPFEYLPRSFLMVLQEIVTVDGKCCAIVTNIEMISKVSRGFEKLWQNKDFMSKVISFVWDEAQCVSKWGDFWPEYKTAGNLQHLIQRTIPFFIISAMLPLVFSTMSCKMFQRSGAKAFILRPMSSM